MKKSKEQSPAINPIANIPSDNSVTAAGILDTSDRDFEVWRMERQLQLLRHRERILLYKLSRCLETLTDEENFWQNGLHYEQWETYDQLMKRKARLRAMRELIVDVNAETQLSETEVDVLRKRIKL